MSNTLSFNKEINAKIPTTGVDLSQGKREIKAFIRGPSCGVNENTGILIILHGLGGRQNDISYKIIRKEFAEAFNLITVGINYIGTDVYINDSSFAHEEIKEMLVASNLHNFLHTITDSEQETIITLDRNKFACPCNPLAKDELQKPLANNFWDYGYLQSLDILSTLHWINDLLRSEKLHINFSNVHLVGESAGSQIAAMCLKLAPKSFASFLDINGIPLGTKKREVLSTLLTDPYGKFPGTTAREVCVTPFNRCRIRILLKVPLGFNENGGSTSAKLEDELIIRDVLFPKHYSHSDIEGVNIFSIHAERDPTISFAEKNELLDLYKKLGGNIETKIVRDIDVDDVLFQNTAHNCVKSSKAVYRKFGEALWKKKSNPKRISDIGSMNSYSFPTPNGEWKMTFSPAPHLTFIKKTGKITSYSKLKRSEKSTLKQFLKVNKNKDKTILRFLDAQQNVSCVSWKELIEQSAGSAQWMSEQGIRKGTILPIFCASRFEQIRDFLGAIFLGAIPCIMAPPNIKMFEKVFLKKLFGMFGQENFEACIISKKLQPFFKEKVQKNLPSLKVHTQKEIVPSSPEKWLRKEYLPNDPLFLQHSSGTSGVPKGVVITYQMLQKHLEDYGKTLSICQQDSIVSWLPLYHDMGMIACLWGSLLWNIPSTHISNFQWILDPEILFQEISSTQQTLTWMPNFAFSLLEKSAQRTGKVYDLSSIRKWINCSEPVLANTLEDYLENTRHFDVKKESLSSCYAMAENVFAVSQSPTNPTFLFASRNALERIHRFQEAKSDEPYRKVASSGKIMEGVSIAIRSSSGEVTENEENLLGEILLKSHTMLREYYCNPKATEKTFHNGWYATGDVGFIHNKELFIIGRKKDLIIIGGRNLDPTEVEDVANEIEGIISGRLCCIGLESETTGTQEAHLVLETNLEKEEHGTLIRNIKKIIFQQTEFQLKQAWCVPPKWLIKSSSGKIARKENKEKLLKWIETGAQWIEGLSSKRIDQEERSPS